MNWSADEAWDCPAALVILISTVPAEPAGLVAVIEVALFTVYELAVMLLPNITLVTPVKPVPVMVTLVPPATGPADGEMPVTVGFPKVN